MPAKPSDKYIPWYFVAFFVVLAGVNAVFVYLATSTHTGVVTEQAYEKGLDYNTVITSAKASEMLGWEADITVGENGETAVKVLAAEGAPIEGADVKLHAFRPAKAGDDFSKPLAEIAPGLYTGKLTFPIKGQWEVRVAVAWNNQHFQKSKRVVIR